MVRTKVYRIDEYHKNHGELIGFFKSSGYKQFISDKVPTNTAWDTHFQVTACYMDIPAGVNLTDTKRVLEDDIWGAADILNTTLYISL